ncbi:MAG: hypothetical protein Q4D77_00220 [Peptostreptococcaceae bacterium]|nr:hypothetical protein [Peptostreptococcaceae bacterium]
MILIVGNVTVLLIAGLLGGFIYLWFKLCWVSLTGFIKAMALCLDMLIIFVYSLTGAHEHITQKIAEGYFVYLWNIVFALVPVILYGLILVAIHRFFPRISKGVNFVVVFTGVLYAIPFTVKAFTYILSGFSNIKMTDEITMFTNQTANDILYFIIVGVVTYFTFNKRMLLIERTEELIEEKLMQAS